MPDYAGAWYLEAATPMLARSTFIPNHPDFGRYNGVLFKALQGVETGRLTPDEAIEFLEDEMTNELRAAEGRRQAELRLRPGGAATAPRAAAQRPARMPAASTSRTRPGSTGSCSWGRRPSCCCSSSSRR